MPRPTTTRIRLNEEYLLVIEKYSFILQKKKRAKNSKNENWRIIGYYDNLASLAKRIRTENLRIEKALTFSEFSSLLTAQEAEVGAICDGLRSYAQEPKAA